MVALALLQVGCLSHKLHQLCDENAGQHSGLTPTLAAALPQLQCLPTLSGVLLGAGLSSLCAQQRADLQIMLQQRGSA